MPVISTAIAAVAAVSFVTAATAVATVATAVVAVSAAIGTIGLAVSAVGMITGNETLTKVGSVMGYVGLAGGVAGGVLGGIGGLSSGAGFLKGVAQPFADTAKLTSEAWKSGIGSWFDEAAGAKVTGAAPTAAPKGPASAVDARGIGTEFPSTSTGPSSGPGGSVQGGGYVMQPGGPTAPTPTPFAPPSVTAPSAPIAPPPPVAQGSVVPTTASMFPSQPVVPQINPLSGGGTGILGGLTETASTLPDWVKYSAMTTGAQGLSGALGGWFQGASAEQRLELEQLINQQNQNQVQYLNRNNQYAPLIQFPGLANT